MDQENKVFLPDGDDTNGLGMILAKLFSQTLEEPAKLEILKTMNFNLGIQDKEDVKTAVTISFKTNFLEIKNGIIDNPEIYIESDLRTLLDLTSVKGGLFLMLFSRDGFSLLIKIIKGELKIKGVFNNYKNFKKFRSLIS